MIPSNVMSSIVGTCPSEMIPDQLSQFAYSEIHRVASAMTEIKDLAVAKPKRQTAKQRVTVKAQIVKGKEDQLRAILSNPKLPDILKTKGLTLEEFEAELRKDLSGT